MYSSICDDVTHGGQESIDEIYFDDLYAYSEPQLQECLNMLDWNVIIPIRCDTALWTKHTLSIKYCDNVVEFNSSSKTVIVNEYEYCICNQTVGINIMDDDDFHVITTTDAIAATDSTDAADVNSTDESLMYTTSVDDREDLYAFDGQPRDKITNVINDSATLTIIVIRASHTSDSNDNTLDYLLSTVNRYFGCANNTCVINKYCVPYKWFATQV